MDRSAANRALAKAIAYVECGKPEHASEWLEALVQQFEDEGVLARQGARPRTPELLDAQDLSAASGYFGRRLR